MQLKRKSWAAEKGRQIIDERNGQGVPRRSIRSLLKAYFPAMKISYFWMPNPLPISHKRSQLWLKPQFGVVTVALRGPL